MHSRSRRHGHLDVILFLWNLARHHYLTVIQLYLYICIICVFFKEGSFIFTHKKATLKKKKYQILKCLQWLYVIADFPEVNSKGKRKKKLSFMAIQVWNEVIQCSKNKAPFSNHLVGETNTLIGVWIWAKLAETMKPCFEGWAFWNVDICLKVVFFFVCIFVHPFNYAAQKQICLSLENRGPYSTWDLKCFASL